MSSVLVECALGVPSFKAGHTDGAVMDFLLPCLRDQMIEYVTGRRAFLNAPLRICFRIEAKSFVIRDPKKRCVF